MSFFTAPLGSLSARTIVNYDRPSRLAEKEHRGELVTIDHMFYFAFLFLPWQVRASVGLEAVKCHQYFKLFA